MVPIPEIPRDTTEENILLTTRPPKYRGDLPHSFYEYLFYENISAVNLGSDKGAL